MFLTTRKSTCDLLLCHRCRSRIKHVTQKAQDVCSYWWFRQLYSGVTTILFCRIKKRQVRIFKLNWLCILVKLLIHYTPGHKRKDWRWAKWNDTLKQRTTTGRVHVAATAHASTHCWYKQGANLYYSNCRVPGPFHPLVGCQLPAPCGNYWRQWCLCAPDYSNKFRHEHSVFDSVHPAQACQHTTRTKFQPAFWYSRQC